MAKVKLKDIFEGMELQMDEMPYYLHRPTGAVFPLTGDCIDAAESGDEHVGCEMPDACEEARRMAEHPEEYLPVPKRRSNDEWGIMRDFIETVDDEMQAVRLLDAIEGRGAFRRFKNRIREFGIEKRWYAFRDRAFAEIARAWCAENDVAYEE